MQWILPPLGGLCWSHGLDMCCWIFVSILAERFEVIPQSSRHHVKLTVYPVYILCILAACCHVKPVYTCCRAVVCWDAEGVHRDLFSPSIPQHKAPGERRGRGCFINNLTCGTEISSPPRSFVWGKVGFCLSTVLEEEGEPGLTDKEERRGGREESGEFFNFLHKTGWL